MLGQAKYYLDVNFIKKHLGEEFKNADIAIVGAMVTDNHQAVEIEFITDTINERETVTIKPKLVRRQKLDKVFKSNKEANEYFQSDKFSF
jgi:vacuolar-type H+-ATPase subunit I/STV1